MRLIGLDPGLRHTGWGIIEAAGPRLRYVCVVYTTPSPR
ncbi:MAG: crossover junction endodeoxyribonuclease RuvC, partial [Rhodospirillaceae bacterium]|nr:crossover junction endodeoxyribonuclease RuvC [Rhodospirillaceae bacterium]